MIIGRYILRLLIINVRFIDATIEWEDQLIPMKIFANIWQNEHPTRKDIKETVFCLVKPSAKKESTDIVVKILDSNYKEVNLTRLFMTLRI